MKFTLKAAIAGSALIVFLYTACNKAVDSVPPAKTSAPLSINTQASSSFSSTPSLADISALVTQGLKQGLFGGFDAFDVKNGINKPSVLSGVVNTPCGYEVNKNLHYNFTTADNSIAHVSGKMLFSFICSTREPVGVNVDDSLYITRTSPTASLVYKINENFSMHTFSVADPGSPFILNGVYNRKITTHYTTGSGNTVQQTIFRFRQLTISQADHFDIKSGVAHFTFTQGNSGGTLTYQGLIVFNGDFMADITINGQLFHIMLN